MDLDGYCGLHLRESIKNYAFLTTTSYWQNYTHNSAFIARRRLRMRMDVRSMEGTETLWVAEQLTTDIRKINKNVIFKCKEFHI